MKEIRHWINGQLSTVTAARKGDIYNPATGEITGSVAFADAALITNEHGKVLSDGADVVLPSRNCFWQFSNC